MRRIMLFAGGIIFGVGCTIAVLSAIDHIGVQVAGLPGLHGLGWLHSRQVTNVERSADHDHNGLMIRLSPERISAAGIIVVQASEGALQRHLRVPGSVILSADRIGRVAVKLLGTVTELRKRLGDNVKEGEVVAVIESREVADAKREFLSARLTQELQQTLVVRAKNLWEGRALAENEYLRVRNASDDARVRLAGARQKLSALGLTEQQIDDLPQQPIESLRRQELRAPISGRIAERRADLGALVGREGQESELYVIVDLSEVWADLAVSPADLNAIREGEEISIVAGVTGERTQAAITFVSPILDKETRSARVIATIRNTSGAWRPGLFITADIPMKSEPAKVLVPKDAVQRIESVVFVWVNEGFVKRVIRTGRQDDRNIEIVEGLTSGQRIAGTHTFVLKAELGRAYTQRTH